MNLDHTDFTAKMETARLKRLSAVMQKSSNCTIDLIIVKCIGLLVVVLREWEDYPAEILLADKGWAYRSKEEAEDALPKVAAEMGVQYVL